MGEMDGIWVIELWFIGVLSIVNGVYKPTYNWGREHHLVVLYLVGGLEHLLFFYISRTIIPLASFFSEGLKPPTSIVIEIILVFYYRNDEL